MSPRDPSYVPLWCKSHFSFLEGASDPGELVEEARALGLRALAVTDRDGVAGIVRAHVAAREHGVRLLVGSEVTLDDGTTLVLLAADRGGYARLCRLVTEGRLRSPKGTSRVRLDEVCAHAPGLLALWGGGGGARGGDGALLAEGGVLREAFGDRLYALLARHRRADEVPRERRLRRAAAALRVPSVAAVEVLYHAPPRRELQDVLTCIRHGVSLSTAGRLLRPNGEHALLAPEPFRALFPDDRGAVERTLDVAERCTFSMDELRYVYPSEALPDGTTTGEHLRRLVLEGARGRYGGRVPPDVLAQVEKELALIDELDYAGYFLTMHEIVRWCRDRGILCQGRGSAANSAVCWCLGITAVDPVRMELLFERFLSRERAEPPDIDLDIEHERREEVIQHVYERYGRDRAAMVAVVIRYRAKSAVRDVGKALGLAPTALDRLARFTGHDGAPSPETLERAGFDPDAPAHRLLVRLSGEILGSPRHLSIHPGGFLLGHEPVHDLVPVENAAMEARTVIQWDKDDVEALGLFKVDLLGLGALTHLRRCFALLRAHRECDLSMATIPPEDPETFDMIARGDTVGVFQVESRAQMAMLPRLRPRRFYDLVIEVSIVRPGPIAGGMVHPYLRRRAGVEPVEYPHPCLVPVLEKTLGVPLFQEQVMRLAVVAADYTPGEADQLRRDMAAWRKTGRLDGHRDRLVTRMVEKGIAPEFAERVFEQIRGFGEYGFPESHAASFALLAYATAYLRRHWPAEFTAALLNSLPMGFYSPATLVGDARRMDVEVRPVDVDRSARDCTLEPRPGAAAPRDRFAVRMGLRFVKGLGEAEALRVEEARRAGPFASVADLGARARLGERALRFLAEAGALDPLRPGRREALWEVKGLRGAAPVTLPMAVGEREATFAALSSFEEVTWDLHASHHSARGHPLEGLRDALREGGFPEAREVAWLPEGSRVRYAGLAICRQRPGTAGGVVFMTLEDETGFVNTVLWARVFEKYAAEVRTLSFLGVDGRVQRTDGVVHVVVDRVFDPPLRRAPPKAASRDFR